MPQCEQRDAADGRVGDALVVEGGRVCDGEEAVQALEGGDEGGREGRELDVWREGPQVREVWRSR